MHNFYGIFSEFVMYERHHMLWQDYYFMQLLVPAAFSFFPLGFPFLSHKCQFFSSKTSYFLGFFPSFWNLTNGILHVSNIRLCFIFKKSQRFKKININLSCVTLRPDAPILMHSITSQMSCHVHAKHTCFHSDCHLCSPQKTAGRQEHGSVLSLCTSNSTIFFKSCTLASFI